MYGNEMRSMKNDIELAMKILLYSKQMIHYLCRLMLLVNLAGNTNAIMIYDLILSSSDDWLTHNVTVIK